MVKTAMKAMGKKDHPSLRTIYRSSVVRLAHRTLNDPSHILFSELDWLPSGRCYRARCLKCKTNHLKLSFIPKSITLLNKEACVACVTFITCLIFKCFGGRCNIQLIFTLHYYSGSYMICPCGQFFLLLLHNVLFCCCSTLAQEKCPHGDNKV